MRDMATIDGRTLEHNTLEHIRIQAVRRVVEDGESPSAVMESFGLCRTTIYPWLRDFKKHEMDSANASHPCFYLSLVARFQETRMGRVG